MNKTKKILSIILAVMMILTAVPLTGMTAFAVSDGERIDPGKYGLIDIDNPLHTGDDRVEFFFSGDWWGDGFEGGITEISRAYCTKYIDTDEYYGDCMFEPEQYSCEWIWDGYDYYLFVYDITEPGLYSVWIESAIFQTLDEPWNIINNVWFDFYIPETNSRAVPVSHDEPVFSCSYENGAVSLDFDSVDPMFRNGDDDIEVFMDGNSVPVSIDTYNYIITFECPFEPGTSKHIEIPFVGLDYSTSSFYHTYYFNIDTTLYFNKDGTVTAGYSTDPEEPAHEHSFATEWTKNETAHWHECTEDCDIEDYATCGLDGAAYGEHSFVDCTCTICGYYDADAALSAAKTDAKATVNALAGEDASDAVKAIIAKAVEDIEAAADESAVNSIVAQTTSKVNLQKEVDTLIAQYKADLTAALSNAWTDEAKDILTKALADIETAATISEANSIGLSALSRAKYQDDDFTDSLNTYKSVLTRALSGNALAAADNYLDTIIPTLEACTNKTDLNAVFKAAESAMQYYTAMSNIDTRYDSRLSPDFISDETKALAADAIEALRAETDFDKFNALCEEYDRKVSLSATKDNAIYELLKLATDDDSAAVTAIIEKTIADIKDAETQQDTFTIYFNAKDEIEEQRKAEESNLATYKQEFYEDLSIFIDDNISRNMQKLDSFQKQLGKISTAVEAAETKDEVDEIRAQALQTLDEFIPDEYTVIVEGAGTLVGQELDINKSTKYKIATVTISNANGIDSNGNWFVYWKDANTGEIVSSYSTYKFFVTKDITLTPVYVDPGEHEEHPDYYAERNKAVITTRMDGFTKNVGGTFSLFSEYSVSKIAMPTVLGHGIICTTDESLKDSLEYGNDDVENYAAVKTATDYVGTQKTILEVTESTTVYTRSYIIDGDGNIHYSEIKEYFLDTTPPIFVDGYEEEIVFCGAEDFSLDVAEADEVVPTAVETEPETAETANWFTTLITILTAIINWFMQILGI